MSLNRLKEALRPCSSQNHSSSSTSYSQLSSLSSSDLSHSVHPPGRKPPKTSLSKQLLRLQDFTNSPLLPKKPIPPPPSLPPAIDQLRPLDRPDFDGRRLGTQSKTKQPKQSVNDDDNGDVDEEVDKDEEEASTRPRLDPSIFEPTGPYEPLVLSLPGYFPVVQVPASINCRLLPHQREGVAFLYRMYNDNHGGILGDDMGLGKTIQTIAFLAAVFGKDGESLNYDMGKGSQYKDKNPVLIICPSSVIHNWEVEFSKWANFSVSIFHGPNRDLILDKLGSKGVEILITSFDTFRIQGTSLSDINWEIVVVDEAHKLKNEKSKLYQACMEIKTMKRYGLTGTIMQNKIMELFNLFDWVAPGSLGSREHFRDYYDEPLKQGQRLTAPERFVQVAEERKKHLVTVLRKFLLRRTKDETIGHLMMGKEDNVVFCGMSDVQKRAYRRMLQMPEIQCLMNKDLPCSCGSPLSQVECCKRTVPDGIIWRYLHTENPEGCNYCPFCVVLPCLMKLQQISNHLELIKPNPKDDQEKQKKDAEFAAAVLGPDIDLAGGTTQSEDFMSLSDVKHCGKMRALEKLMSSWLSQGDKILIFSHSVRMLDILEKLLIRKGYCFSRLDGSTPTGARQSLVDDFNTCASKQVFLISTRAGGLGLNLVSANRVVIFDPNWNPAHDLQAQDRSFRFGQKRHVVVFRLLAAGSLEELVYSRQVYKQQLSNIAVSGKMEKRYFEGVQDCKQFQGELFGIHNLFKDLSDKLFTSEIIELHEQQQGQESLSQGLKQRDLGNLGVHFASSLDRESPSHDPTNRKVGPGQVARKATVEDLGIVYAHRNEDIVNFGSGVQENEELATEISIQTNPPAATSRKRKEHISSLSREKKKKQFDLMAKSRGMDEIEFSKWILSSSRDELEEVLQDYKNRRRKVRRT